MDFELTKEQKDIQQAVRDFVKGEFKKDVIDELVKNHEYPVAIWKKAAELGLMGINLPEKYSGQDMGVMENILVCEELCRGDSSVGVCLTLANFASGLVLGFGSEELKAAWLPRVSQGEVLSCGGFTEPNHGSDITATDTMAVKDNDEWIINGSKIFITNAGPLAGFYNVLCTTDPNAEPSYRGLSLILVEADRSGLEVTDVGDKMGISLCYTGEVVFNDVRVPCSNLIGEENRGLYQVLDFFNESRILVAAQALGIAQGAFDRALDYVKKREQFGKTIAQYQATQHKLADMATKIETARLLTYKAAWNCDQGHADVKQTSMAKMLSARVAVEVADEAIQMLGGYGYMRDNEVERFYRDAKITEIYEGTREIQKNTIARCLIGDI